MFSSKSPFEEVFPEIEDISVEVVEEGYMVKKTDRGTYKLSKENIRSTFPCNNISCKRNGGINIQPLIEEMVRKKETYQDTSLACNGYETSMKRDCLNGYDIKIVIKYKENLAK